MTGCKFYADDDDGDGGSFTDARYTVHYILMNLLVKPGKTHRVQS